MSKPSQLDPLSPDEATKAREAFKTMSDEKTQSFVNWMIRSGQFSGKVASEIRTFLQSVGK